jgi:hypothetical protein
MERQAPPLPPFVSLRDVLDIQWTTDDAKLGELEERLIVIVSVVRTFGADRGVNKRIAGLVWDLMLGGELAVLQAPMFDGLSLDPFTLFDDGWCPAEVDVCRRHIIQALVVTLVVVVLDESLDLGFEVAGQEVVLEQDAVLHGLVPAFDLALGLWMVRRTFYGQQRLATEGGHQRVLFYFGTIQSIQLRAAAREAAALPLLRYEKGTR